MDVFGDLSGIVFNRRTARLVGGHQRTRVMDDTSRITITKKWAKPTATGTVVIGHVIVDGERWTYREVDVHEDVEAAMNIRANNPVGEWDFDKLAKMLKAALPSMPDGMSGAMGFHEDMLAGLTQLLREPEEFPDLDPSMADEVKTTTCPECGHEFPV